MVQVGSNLFLFNRQLSAEYKQAWLLLAVEAKKCFSALRAGGGARSVSNSTDFFSLLVGVGGLEPPTSRSQSAHSAN